jgi:hypothetical protein
MFFGAIVLLSLMQTQFRRWGKQNQLLLSLLEHYLRWLVVTDINIISFCSLCYYLPTSPAMFFCTF